MSNLRTIQLRKDYFHFSAAHFTVFSAHNRERLHGHNFRIGVNITGSTDDNGLCFDYAIIKNSLRKLCEQLDEYTLIAEFSPYLEIQQDDHFYTITHNQVSFPLLKTDTILLPVKNITIEELSHYFLSQLLADKTIQEIQGLHSLEILASSGPNQWCSSVWENDANTH